MILENIDIDIDKVILENIDIDKYRIDSNLAYRTGLTGGQGQRGAFSIPLRHRTDACGAG